MYIHFVVVVGGVELLGYTWNLMTVKSFNKKMESELVAH